MGDRESCRPRLSGSLAFDDLWLPQNGHILLVPLGLLVLLARLTSWNISAQLAVNLLVAVGGFAVMVSMLPPEWRRSARVRHVWLVPGMAVLAFSARQWENWVWSWQLQIFICITTALVALALLARAGGWWSFVGAVVSCITATFSFAVGSLVWPLGLVVVRMSRRYRQRNVHALVWLVLGVATMLVYGHALSRVDSSPSDITWPSLWALGAYLLVYLGGPLTSEPLVQVGTAAFF